MSYEEQCNAFVRKVAALLVPDECREHGHDIFQCRRSDCCARECFDQWSKEDPIEALSDMISEARAIVGGKTE